MDLGTDRSTIGALSWRLASELVRRHPTRLTVNRGHPGGGIYDCLMLFPPSSGRDGVQSPGDVQLNRVGSIHVLSRFDGRDEDSWATSWEHYLRSDPHTFLLFLEAAAGLTPPPGKLPGSTNPALLYRLIAQLTALASKSRNPYSVEQGFIDSSGDEVGPNDAINAFPAAARALEVERNVLFHDEEPGLAYWMIFQDGRPRWAFHRKSGAVWTAREEPPTRLPQLYIDAGRRIDRLTFCLLDLGDEK